MDILLKTVQKNQNVSRAMKNITYQFVRKLNKSKNNPINPSLNGPDVPTTMFIDNIKYTLLHTATANISSVNSSKEITSRVLFDTRSQRMFITKELQKN